MARLKAGILIIALILLVLGGYTLYVSNVYHSYQSTFNIGPNRYFRIPTDLRETTTISGNFQESGGRPVSFSVMSSVQFASFQLGSNLGDLYSIQDVPASAVSFTSTASDTYYLVFTHGTGLQNTSETVSFQRSYFSLHYFPIVSGVMMVVLAVVHVVWGLRYREPLPPPPPRW